MDELDKKIKLILSRELEIPNEFRETINSCIENLPEYRNKKENIFSFKKLVQMATVGILSIGVTVFAHNEIQKIENIKLDQTISKVNNEIKVNTYYDSNGIEVHRYDFKYPFDTNEWEKSNLYEYLRITTIEEYNQYKEKYSNIFELEKMTEEDFDNKFLLVIRALQDSYVSDIEADDEILYVNIIRKFDEIAEEMEQKTVISIKIPQNLNREKLQVAEFPLENEYNTMPYIRELVKSDYTKENAIEDRAIATEYNNDDYKDYIISNNKEKLDEFIEKTQNGIEAQIRLIQFKSFFTRFCDLKYENGMYRAYIYIKPIENVNDENAERFVRARQKFIRGKEIKISYSEETKSYTYAIIENTTFSLGDKELPMTENVIIFEYNIE